MSDAIAPQSSEFEQLQQTLLSASSPKKQLAAIPKLIEAETPGHEILQAFLISRSPDIVAGAAYQALVQVETLPVQTFLAEKYPDGILSELPSEQNVDYRGLQLALSRQEFETADTITRQKLCEIAGPAAQKRKWVYFTEVGQFPAVDLRTIDQLWRLYSRDKFGFSIQRKLWLSLGQNYPKLWDKIGWRTSTDEFVRFPGGFTWELSAPVGHLPLSNQLRGVRVISAIFAHPAWQP